MRLSSPFFWKRVRRFVARFPHPPWYTVVTLIFFVILASINNVDRVKRMTAVRSTPTPEILQAEEDTWIDNHIRPLSSEDKMKQLVMWGINEPISSQSADLWKMRKPGGFLITGSHTKTQIASISGSIMDLELLIPPFIALDEEGGPVKRMIDDPNPGAAGLRTSTDDEICSAWKITNENLDSAGITMNLGVIGDIGWKKDVYILPRTYSSSPSAAAKFAALAIACHDRVIPVVKHFPGHGRTVVDSHYGIPRITISEREWLDSDALPFITAIENDIPAVMIGHLLFDKIASDPASLSPVWQEKLRSMGFERLSITDDLGMLSSSGFTVNEAAERAYLAGNDMLLISSTKANPDVILTTLIRAATTSAEKIVPVDERMRRILHEKYLLHIKLVQ